MRFYWMLFVLIFGYSLSIPKIKQENGHHKHCSCRWYSPQCSTRTFSKQSFCEAKRERRNSWKCAKRFHKYSLLCCSPPFQLGRFPSGQRDINHCFRDNFIACKMYTPHTHTHLPNNLCRTENYFGNFINKCETFNITNQKRKKVSLYTKCNHIPFLDWQNLQKIQK